MRDERRLHDALDDCLRDIEEGRSTHESLAEAGEWADELHPLVRAAGELRDAPRPIASQDAFEAGMERMLAAAAEERRRAATPVKLGGRLLTWWQQALAFRFVFAAVTALVVLAIGALLLPSWLGAPVSRTATLSRVDGVVEVLSVGGEGWRPAAVGDEVGGGDRLRTSALSAATLIFFDGSVTELDAETDITLAEITARRRGGGTVVVIHQWIGQTHIQVHPLSDSASRFAVETLTAVMAVHGTEFFISVEGDGSTVIRVAEGLVDVVAEGFATQVAAGEELTVHPTEPRLCVTAMPALTPEPALSPQPTSEMPSESEPELTPTPTRSPTFTPSPSPTSTPSPLPVPTETPVPLPTNTPVPPPTSTPRPLPPATSVPPPTAAPVPPTATPVPPPTATPVPPTATPYDGPPPPSP